ncbi:MAG: hypothetical protein QMC78_02095 [Methanocellales archaeon]|nr:hypothetical protein [Methanocellales archaeon]
MVNILSISKKMLTRKLKKLVQSSEDKGLAIVICDDPMPDSLASALALKRIAEHFHIGAKIFYRGDIQNKTLLNLMEEDLSVLQSIADLNDMKLAFVGAVPSQLKHITRPPSIVIARYEGDTRDIKAELKDIRSDVETTSSIMIEYLKRLKITVDKQLAAQLLYAIRDATRGLIVNLHEFDLKAYLEIFPSADIDLLMRLEHPSVKSETFADLAEAIKNKMLKDTHLVTSIGYTKDPSTLPKVCDYLLDLEGILTVLTFAIGKANIYVYAKSKNIEVHMRNMLEKVFGAWAEARGTPVYATLEIPLGVFETVLQGEKDVTKSKELLFESIKNVVSSKYFAVIETKE